MRDTEETTPLDQEQLDSARLSRLEAELEGQPGTLGGLKLSVARLNIQLESIQLRESTRDVVMNDMLSKLGALNTNFIVVSTLLKAQRIPSAIWLILGAGLFAMTLVSLVFLSERIRIVDPTSPVPAAVVVQAP